MPSTGTPESFLKNSHKFKERKALLTNYKAKLFPKGKLITSIHICQNNHSKYSHEHDCHEICQTQLETELGTYSDCGIPMLGYPYPRCPSYNKLKPESMNPIQSPKQPKIKNKRKKKPSACV
jgi:hypothetical protein